MAADDPVPAASSLLPPPSSLHPFLLAGPTAVGKSAVALRLAERWGSEIISVDSMQVYRGLDLGTAKPTPAERRRVPHHLIDVVELTESFDAARFAALARQAVQEIQARGHIPILCGGTGLYFRAFLEGLGDAPPGDVALRAELERTPMPDLLRELAERDPETFAKIDHQNPRRVLRALEVIRLTGRPFSAQRARWTQPSPLAPRPSPLAPRPSALAPRPSPLAPRPSPLAPRPSPLFLGLSRAADDLRARIDARVEDMFRLGLVAETADLLRRGLAQNRTATQAIGYRQVIEHLRGDRSLADTVRLVKQRTWQFAKRQMTWFRRQADVTWVAVGPDEEAASVVEVRISLSSERGHSCPQKT